MFCFFIIFIKDMLTSLTNVWSGFLIQYISLFLFKTFLGGAILKIITQAILWFFYWFVYLSELDKNEIGLS